MHTGREAKWSARRRRSRCSRPLTFATSKLYACHPSIIQPTNQPTNPTKQTNQPTNRPTNQPSTSTRTQFAWTRSIWRAPPSGADEGRPERPANSQIHWTVHVMTGKANKTVPQASKCVAWPRRVPGPADVSKFWVVGTVSGKFRWSRGNGVNYACL